eukprot:g682.t1
MGGITMALQDAIAGIGVWQGRVAEGDQKAILEHEARFYERTNVASMVIPSMKADLKQAIGDMITKDVLEATLWVKKALALLAIVGEAMEALMKVTEQSIIPLPVPSECASQCAPARNNARYERVTEMLWAAVEKTRNARVSLVWEGDPSTAYITSESDYATRADRAVTTNRAAALTSVLQCLFMTTDGLRYGLKIMNQDGDLTVAEPDEQEVSDAPSEDGDGPDDSEDLEWDISALRTPSPSHLNDDSSQSGSDGAHNESVPELSESEDEGRKRRGKRGFSAFYQQQQQQQQQHLRDLKRRALESRQHQSNGQGATVAGSEQAQHMSAGMGNNQLAARMRRNGSSSSGSASSASKGNSYMALAYRAPTPIPLGAGSKSKGAHAPSVTASECAEITHLLKDDTAKRRERKLRKKREKRSGGSDRRPKTPPIGRRSEQANQTPSKRKKAVKSRTKSRTVEDIEDLRIMEDYLADAEEWALPEQVRATIRDGSLKGDLTMHQQNMKVATTKARKDSDMKAWQGALEKVMLSETNSLTRISIASVVAYAGFDFMMGITMSPDDMADMLTVVARVLEEEETVDLMQFPARHARQLAITCARSRNSIDCMVVTYLTNEMVPLGSEMGIVPAGHGIPAAQYKVALQQQIADATRMLGPYLRSIIHPAMVRAQQEIDLAADGAMQELSSKRPTPSKVTVAVARVVEKIRKAERMLEEGASTDQYLYDAIKLCSQEGGPVLEPQYEEVTGKAGREVSRQTGNLDSYRDIGPSVDESGDQSFWQVFGSALFSEPSPAVAIRTYNPEARLRAQGILLAHPIAGKTTMCEGSHGPLNLIDGDKLVDWRGKPRHMSRLLWRRQQSTLRNHLVTEAAREGIVLVNVGDAQFVRDWVASGIPVVAVSVYRSRGQMWARQTANYLRTGNTINEFQCQSIEDMESYNKMYERVLGGYYRTFAAAMAHLKRIAERAESRSLTVEEVQRADDELKQGGQDTPPSLESEYEQTTMNKSSEDGPARRVPELPEAKDTMEELYGPMTNQNSMLDQVLGMAKEVSDKVEQYEAQLDTDAESERKEEAELTHVWDNVEPAILIPGTRVVIAENLPPEWPREGGQGSYFGGAERRHIVWTVGSIVLIHKTPIAFLVEPVSNDMHWISALLLETVPKSILAGCASAYSPYCQYWIHADGTRFSMGYANAYDSHGNTVFKPRDMTMTEIVRHMDRYCVHCRLYPCRCQRLKQEDWEPTQTGNTKCHVCGASEQELVAKQLELARDAYTTARPPSDSHGQPVALVRKSGVCTHCMSEWEFHHKKRPPAEGRKRRHDDGDEQELVSEKQCSICLNPMGSAPAVMLNRCRHMFHFACINAALQNRSSGSKCPECRAPIAVLETSACNDSGAPMRSFELQMVDANERVLCATKRCLHDRVTTTAHGGMDWDTRAELTPLAIHIRQPSESHFENRGKKVHRCVVAYHLAELCIEVAKWYRMRPHSVRAQAMQCSRIRKYMKEIMAHQIEQRQRSAGMMTWKVWGITCPDRVSNVRLVATADQIAKVAGGYFPPIVYELTNKDATPVHERLARPWVYSVKKLHEDGTLNRLAMGADKLALCHYLSTSGGNRDAAKNMLTELMEIPEELQPEPKAESQQEDGESGGEQKLDLQPAPKSEKKAEKEGLSEEGAEKGTPPAERGSSHQDPHELRPDGLRATRVPDHLAPYPYWKFAMLGDTGAQGYGYISKKAAEEFRDTGAVEYELASANSKSTVSGVDGRPSSTMLGRMAVWLEYRIENDRGIQEKALVRMTFIILSHLSYDMILGSLALGDQGIIPVPTIVDPSESNHHKRVRVDLYARAGTLKNTGLPVIVAKAITAVDPKAQEFKTVVFARRKDGSVIYEPQRRLKILAAHRVVIPPATSKGVAKPVGITAYVEKEVKATEKDIMVIDQVEGESGFTVCPCTIKQRQLSATNISIHVVNNSEESVVIQQDQVIAVVEVIAEADEDQCPITVESKEGLAAFMTYIEQRDKAYTANHWSKDVRSAAATEVAEKPSLMTMKGINSWLKSGDNVGADGSRRAWDRQGMTATEVDVMKNIRAMTPAQIVAELGQGNITPSQVNESVKVAFVLYCGAGGFTAGLSRQKNVKVFGAIDNADKALQTHRANFPDIPAIKHTVGKDHEATLAVMEKYMPRELWQYAYVHASPPCQKISSANFRRTTHDVLQALQFTDHTIALLKKAKVKAYTIEQSPRALPFFKDKHEYAANMEMHEYCQMNQTRRRLIISNLDLQPTKSTSKDSSLAAKLKEMGRRPEAWKSLRQFNRYNAERPLTRPAFTVTNRPLRIGKTLGKAVEVDLEAMQHLQGLEGWSFPEGQSLTDKRQQVADAIPPAFAAKLSEWALDAASKIEKPPEMAAMSAASDALQEMAMTELLAWTEASVAMLEPTPQQEEDYRRLRSHREDEKRWKGPDYSDAREPTEKELDDAMKETGIAERDDLDKEQKSFF